MICLSRTFSHQAIIDSAWEDGLKPALLAKFPSATPEELSAAQAYAYGGAIIQDLGYYPYGSHFFSDLTHYVRSGDFIVALLQDANDIYEYGFALGAMAHYAADNNGHRIGTNRAVPLLYPHLRKKYGDSVLSAAGRSVCATAAGARPREPETSIAKMPVDHLMPRARSNASADRKREEKGSKMRVAGHDACQNVESRWTA